MATPKSQRIGIWVIAIVMLVGTIGSFAVMVLANDNDQKKQAELNAALAEYQKNNDERQKKVDAQADELSKKYFDTFDEYADRPSKFDRDDVKKLEKKDLVKGDGEKLTEDSTFTAYYLGWNPDGKVFDGSIDGKKLKAPFTASPGGVIEGWTKGVAGMKVGGIRELTIPSDMAYGEQGSGDDIPPNTPLKFVIMVIPTPEEIPQAEVPPKVLEYYGQSAQ